MSVEDLYDMPEVPGVRFELVDEELLEVPGATALRTAMMFLFAKLLDAHVSSRHLGRVFPDGLTYVLKRDPDTTSVPDVSFVAASRIPDEGIPDRFWSGGPDLAVVIVSSSDSARDVRRKVRDYIDNGTSLVWVVWPQTREVSVYTPDEPVRELNADDDLDGGDVLPGFRLRVGDLFEIGP
jgi:Uma2 family endonuclease